MTCGDSSPSIEKSKGELKFDLGDQLSEERVERNPIFSGLLNGDVGFVRKLNSSKQIVVSIVFLSLQFVLLISSPSVTKDITTPKIGIPHLCPTPKKPITLILFKSLSLQH